MYFMVCKDLTDVRKDIEQLALLSVKTNEHSMSLIHFVWQWILITDSKSPSVR